MKKFQNDKNNEGIDLNGSLKNSDTGVKFEEYRTPRSYYPGTPKIIQWVIKYSGGIIKNEKQASYVLIRFVAVAVVIALFLIFGSGSGGSKRPPGPPTPFQEGKI